MGVEGVVEEGRILLPDLVLLNHLLLLDLVCVFNWDKHATYTGRGTNYYFALLLSGAALAIKIKMFQLC